MVAQVRKKGKPIKFMGAIRFFNASEMGASWIPSRIRIGRKPGTALHQAPDLEVPAQLKLRAG